MTFIRFCYLALICLLVFLAVENFLLSQSFLTLRFREIDDLAFQYSLRKIHSNAGLHQWQLLLNANDYGYGWIFWMPMSLLTAPLYLLYKSTGVAWPLIVLPRQVSLFFSILTLIYLRKILKYFCFSESLLASALLLFAFTPAFGYYSLRFGTVGQGMFLCCLSIYLALIDEPSTAIGRFRIAVALGLAAGTKISCLMCSPLIFLLIIYNYKARGLRTALDISAFLGPLIIIAVMSSNPSLLFDPGSRIDYFRNLHQFMETPKISSDPGHPFRTFYYAIFGSPVLLLIHALLIYGLANLCVRNGRFRAQAVFVMSALAISLIYLFLNVRNGYSAGAYFTSLSFLLPIGLASIAPVRWRNIAARSLLFLIIIDLSYRALSLYREGPEPTTQSHLSYIYKSLRAVPFIEIAQSINTCLGEPDTNWAGSIFIDYKVPTVFNQISYPQACLRIMWDDFHTAGSACHGSPDFIILSKSDASLLDDVAFAKYLENHDALLSSKLEANRKAVQILLRSTEREQNYSLKCSNNSYLIYASKHLRQPNVFE